MVSETLYRCCAYSSDIRAAVHVRYGVHSFRVLAHGKWSPRRHTGRGTPSSEGIRLFCLNLCSPLPQPMLMIGLKACAMRTGKPVQRARRFCNATRLRCSQLSGPGIDAAPTNDLLDARTFTGRRLKSLGLRPVTSAFRTAFDSYCARTTWGVIYSGRPS
jgi:hypothetical protein